MKIKIKKLTSEAVVPKYETEGAAGFDLVATETTVIEAESTKLIKTGLAFEIPKGYELQIRPRSGMSLKTSLRVANSPGTIDSDYRGEVAIILHNTSPLSSEQVLKGTRIAQAVLCPIIQADFEEVSVLSSTERGEGGFGSTGNQ